MKLFEDIITSRNIDDYPDGIVLCVHKPYRWTSADVIRKIKYSAIRHFGKKNLKVGHAGTLDPLAEGLLLICIGNATKRAESLQATEKEYIARICFGATTPSYDLEKDIDRFMPHDGVTAESVAKALESFIGEQEQIAPLFSAKQIDGVRAYELAREMHAEGRDLDEEALNILHISKITIFEAELLEFGEHGLSEPSAATLELSRVYPEGRQPRINVASYAEHGLPEALVRIRCSKGTYIRSFARDLGEKLGTGAFLSGLLRTKCGDHSLDAAVSVE